jgi:acylphosphatase
MVGFRAFALEKAEDLGLAGTVANRPDGSVECVAEGPRELVEELIRHLQEGPLSARVEKVDVLEQPARGDVPPMRVSA